MDEPLRIQPIEECRAVGRCLASPSEYAGYMGTEFRFAKPTPKQVAAHALQKLEAARAVDIATHEKNLPAIAINQAVAARIEALMVEVGMPRGWSERDTKSRARLPKTITHEAGWIGDVRRHCKTSDGFEYATRSYEDLLRRYQAFAERAEQEAQQAARDAEREAQQRADKRRADMELAAILLRYGLPIESTWSDALDALRKKNQRLNLAIAMEQTRGDWSEGPHRVSDALEGFEIQTTEDKDIANDVLSCLTDFSDGRVFRDTAWSYGALYASIPDQQLVTDARLALGRAGSDY